MKKHHRHENDCLNCGIELQGHYCHSCGQENLHVKEPFWHFLSHSISHYFHFDSKFFSTLKPLLTQPGQLTLDYLAGRRMRYLHPVSMYIFVSIIYFLVVPNLNHTKENDNVHIRPLKGKETAFTVNTDSDDDDDTTTNAALHPTGVPKTHADSMSREIVKKLIAEPVIKQVMVIDSLKKIYKQHPTDGLKKRIDSLKQINKIKADSLTEAKVTQAFSKGEHWGFVRWMMNINKEIRKPEFEKEMEHYKPKLYFILMPLFAFFLMLNFRRNHRYYVEHIVFTIHFFTAFFIFEIIVKPINHFVFGDSSLINLLMWCAVLWYCYTALRVFYQRTQWATIRKMITLSIYYGIAFGVSSVTIATLVYLVTK